MRAEGLRKMRKTPHLTSPEIKKFRETIFHYYHEPPRSFPWRRTRNPYHVLVSEMMLQQTQTDRVVKKYTEFITTFPHFASLARAPLRKVLRVWQGLGYNRRALALKQIAEKVVTDFKGKLPSSREELELFPGIGATTAGEICAFAFNQPTVFIETNIRAVYIHFFFPRRRKVNDAEIVPLLEQTVDTANSREWYYALMDYGVMLKGKYPNPSRKSASYRRQAPFKGSNREVRGKIIRLLSTGPPLTPKQIIGKLGFEQERIENAVKTLQKEGLLKKRRSKVTIAD